MALIYKITNLINNKIYIGSTIKTLEQRYKEHCRPVYKKKSLLTRSILKYGRENFKIELLENCDDSVRIKKEYDYIKSNNSLFPIGYNLTDMFEYGLENGFLKKRTPSQLCIEKARQSRIGSKHTQETKELMSQKKKNIPRPKQRKKIIATNIETKISTGFYSIKDASSFLNLPRRRISNVLNGWSKTTGKYTFLYQEEDYRT